MSLSNVCPQIISLEVSFLTEWTLQNEKKIADIYGGLKIHQIFPESIWDFMIFSMLLNIDLVFVVKKGEGLVLNK